MFALLMTELQYEEPYAKCRQQIDKLKKYITKLKKEKFPIKNALQHRAKHNDKISLPSKNYQFDTRCSYSHSTKIYDLNFSSCSDRIVSGSWDSRLLICDTNKAKRFNSVPLKSAYVMKCTFSPNGKFVASGGLDNVCSIYNIENLIGWECRAPVAELWQHEGFVSGIDFVDDNQIMTASGDSTAILWDIERQTAKTTFAGHTGDIYDLCMHPNKTVFVTAAVDATAKIWEIRAAKIGAIYTFTGHDSDLNCCRWFPNGYDFMFATGGVDDKIRLWDWRSKQQLNVYAHGDESNYGTVHSIDFSKSGYYLFAGYDEEPVCVAWNTMTGEKEFALEHVSNVTCVRISPDGYQIATGCWDRKVRFWSLSV